MKVWRCEVTKEMGVEFLVWAETRDEANKAAEEIAEGIDDMDWDKDGEAECWPREVPMDTRLADEIKLYGIWVGGPGGKFVFDSRVPEPEPPDPRQPGPGQTSLLDPPPASSREVEEGPAL